MAKAISNEEIQLRKRARRRLVGAIALVLVVVVFLPMILDNEPKPVSEDVAINIPPPPVATAVKTPVESGPSAKQSATSSAKQEYVVQLGAFSDAGNAARLAKTVSENRFDVYTEVVTTSGGKRTRVRVGPYPTRAEALNARDRLKARKLTYGEPDIVRSDER